MAVHASELTRSLKKYDRDLFCEYSQAHGVHLVYRKVKRFESVCEDDGFSLKVLREFREIVCALTATWGIGSEARAWGTDRVLDRIRSMDLALNERLFEEFEKAEEASQKSKDRHLQNELEAWASDSRREFARATEDIVGCVHSLDKTEKRKRRKDRSIKNGNY